MSKRNKNTKKKLDDFLRYSQDQMSDEERNAFERELQQDPFEAEALEGLSSITPKEVHADLSGLRSLLRRRTKQSTQSTKATWYGIAAAVTVLLVVTTVLFTLFNDRMRLLDWKVAESPETEKKEVPVTTPGEEIDAEPSMEISPMQTIEEDEEPVESVTPQARKEDQVIDVDVLLMEETIEEGALEAKVEADITVERISEELAEADELDDIRTEKIADMNEAEVEIEEEFQKGEAAAPAMAVERTTAAKSRKMKATEQLQMAGAETSRQRIVSGVVISEEDNQPLNGVIVAVKGSNTGTITDLKGKFQISIEEGTDKTLIAQFIGMESKEIPVQDRKELLITLAPDEIALEEVVIIETGARQIGKPVGYSVDVVDLNEELRGKNYRGATPVPGKKEYNEYIINNIHFPEEETLTRAVVILNFVIGLDGRPGQVTVLKSPGKVFSNEAIRLLVEGPDWDPAELDGQFYEQNNRIRIVFKRERP